MNDKQRAMLEFLGFTKVTDTHYQNKTWVVFYNPGEACGLFSLVSCERCESWHDSFDNIINYYLDQVDRQRQHFNLDGKLINIMRTVKDAEFVYTVVIQERIQADEELSRMLTGLLDKSVPLDIIKDKLRDLQ